MLLLIGIDEVVSALVQGRVTLDALDKSLFWLIPGSSNLLDIESMLSPRVLTEVSAAGAGWMLGEVSLHLLLARSEGRVADDCTSAYETPGLDAVLERHGLPPVGNINFVHQFLHGRVQGITRRETGLELAMI